MNTYVNGEYKELKLVLDKSVEMIPGKVSYELKEELLNAVFQELNLNKYNIRENEPYARGLIIVPLGNE